MTKRLARTTALLTIVLYACIAPLRASADLPGSLIVAVTPPAAGSTITGTVPVNASVSVVGALTVAGVQFQSDGVNIGTEDNAAPYSVPWNTTTATNGSHALSAVARDSLGRTWTSNPVTVTVANDITAPTVSISSPASGATVSGTITVTVSAADDTAVTGVQFFVDGIAGTDVTTAPYSAPWNTNTTTNGSHTLTAVARDAAGNRTTSAPVTVTVANDSTAPTVSINPATTSDAPRVGNDVTASTADDTAHAGVQFFLDGTPGTDVTSAPFTAPWNTNTATNGSHTLTAVARDAAGNRTTSAPVTVTVANDRTAPTVSINQATAQADPTGASPIAFTAVFSEAVSGFSATDVTIGGTAGGTTTATVSGGPSTYSIAVSGMTTSGTVTASIAAGAAQDAAGNSSSASTSTDNSVSFDAAAPTVSITSPASGDTISGTITVTVSAADDTGVTGVQFFLDGIAGTDVTTAPSSATWNTNSPATGPHPLT